MILLILLPLLLLCLSLFCLFLFLAPLENFIDNFAAFEQVLHVFFGLLAYICNFGWRRRLAFGISVTVNRRLLARGIVHLIDRALI